MLALPQTPNRDSFRFVGGLLECLGYSLCTLNVARILGKREFQIAPINIEGVEELVTHIS